MASLIALSINGPLGPHGLDKAKAFNSIDNLATGDQSGVTPRPSFREFTALVNAPE